MSNFDINDLALSVGLSPGELATGNAAGGQPQSSELDEVQDILNTQSAAHQQPEQAGVTPPGSTAPQAPELDHEAIARFNANVPATPRARKVANQLGVHLGALALINGDNRLITHDQVRDWAEATGRTRRPAAAAVRPTTGALLITRASAFDPGRSVSVNDYGTNPAVEDIRQVFPEKYAAAIAANDPAPTLFATGDQPVFTASGLPTSALAPLPWPARAPAAAATSTAAAAEIVNHYTPTPGRDRESLAREAMMLYGRANGNVEYIARVAAWLGKYVYRDGRWVHPAQANVF